MDPISIEFAKNTTLVLQTTSQTAPWQFWITMIVGGISLLIFIPILLGGLMQSIQTKIILHYLKIKLGKNVLLIKHGNDGFLMNGMINRYESLKISKALTKFQNKPFYLILHTPGGEIFGTQLISRMLTNYPAPITALIPFYAMSGGTMLTLSCKNIGLGPNACLGCVDPQIGGIFSSGSAKAWNKVMRLKGKKAADNSIIYQMMGQQYTQTIQNDLMQLCTDKFPNTKQAQTFVEDITNGNIEHGKPFTYKDLQQYGLNVGLIRGKILKILYKLLSIDTTSGIYYA